MTTTELDPNEIRDFLQRAPKRMRFDGSRMVFATHSRLAWLASIARGSINERINRRAGIQDTWRPFYEPISKACARHRRRQMKIAGTPCLVYCI